jgi:hypothetical protein
VIKALKHHGHFTIRSIVRDKNIPEASKLSSMGELVQGDLAHPESLRQCLQGCYGFFCMTDCFDPHMAGREAELGKAMAKIALDCGIEHFMFSTQPDPRSESKGKYNVPSFSDKAEVHKYASTLPFKYHTYLAPSFYFQNWDEICCPVREPDGVFTYKLPISDKAFISGFDVEELGHCALNAFLNPLAWGNGEVIPLVASHMHPSEYFGVIEQHSGQKIRFESVSPECFVKCAEKCHLPAANELAEWFRWINDYGYFGTKYNISDGHKLLGRPMKTFRQWVKDNNFKITHWQNIEGGGVQSDKGVETFHGSRLGHSAAAGSKIGEHGVGAGHGRHGAEKGLPVESGTTATTTSEGIGAGPGPRDVLALLTLRPDTLALRATHALALAHACAVTSADAFRGGGGCGA